MKLKLINPNTTWHMTHKIDACARQVAAPGTVIESASPSMGPASIESYYDEALAVPGLLQEIRSGETAGCDAYIVACFGDPGLDAARELAKGPVIGIAQAAMHLASMVGTGFTVVTTLGRTCNQAWHLAERYGMTRFCRNVRACEVPVLELDQPGSGARALILASCMQALEDDGCDVLVLGCAGMADLCEYISAETGVPVIDGVTAAVKLAESLVSLKLKTSTRGDFAAPPHKAYSGVLAPFGMVR